MKRKTIYQIFLNIIGLLIILVSVFPFYIMLLSALSPNRLQTIFPPLVFFKEITFDNFAYLFNPELVGFLMLLKNSLIVSILAALISTIIGIGGGYAVARFRFPGRFVISQIILLVYMFSGVVLVIPLFKIMLDLRLYNTHPGLIVSYLVLSVPLALYLCANYFRSLPESVEEAGLIAGCSYFQIIRYIIIPMSMPAIVAVFVFTFILCYNEYLFASILLRSRSLYTLPVGIHRFWQNSDGELLWGALNTAALLVSAVVLILYGLVQRFMVKGLTMGAEK